MTLPAHSNREGEEMFKIFDDLIQPGSVMVGNDVIELPKVGSLIKLDARRVGERLVACECPGFAPFRYPSSSLQAVTGCVGPACRVEVTGRSVQFRDGGVWVRVKVHFAGDGEPGTTAGGWLRVWE